MCKRLAASQRRASRKLPAAVRWPLTFAALVASPAFAGDAERLTFRAGCEAGDRIVVAAVGDLLFHNALQRQALAKGGSYRELWRPLEPVLRAADITYGNLEGPVAEGVSLIGRPVTQAARRWDGNVYGAPRGALNFNYHPSLVDDLVASGFDIVSTANNHAADRGPLGIDRTVQALTARGLAFSGTRSRSDLAQGKWAVKTEDKGFTIAWIACSYSTNGMPDRHGQVLNCYSARDRILKEIRWNAADPDVDAVILTPHWGVEKSAAPLASDRAYAREAIEAGATAIVGTHPHVLQGWEKLTTADGRDGLVIYSTGNFVSNQVSDDQRTGIVAAIEMTRRAAGGKAEVSAAGFIPTWVERGPHQVREMKIATGDRLPAPLRRLPSGNRIAADGLRDLPRDCQMTASVDAAATR